jgi:hypothetical protein
MFQSSAVRKPKGAVHLKDDSSDCDCAFLLSFDPSRRALFFGAIC